MTTILGISGSLRRGSFNSSLLRAAAELAPPGASIEIASIRDIPLYDGDLESESGIPAAVSALRERIAGAGALLLATPEYNSSVPGVLKNTIDWLSRPATDVPPLYRDLPVALMGATPGGGGTILAQAAWLPIFRGVGARVWSGPRLMVSGASKVFDAEGRLTDEGIKKQLQSFVAGFAEFIQHAK